MLQLGNFRRYEPVHTPPQIVYGQLLMPLGSDEIAETLARIPLFSALAKDELAALAKAVVVRHVPAKAKIVEQGEPGKEMFALVVGTAQVLSLGAEGKDLLLGLMGPGDVFGEIALLDGGTRSASVRAKTACVLLVLDQDAFSAAIVAHPSAALKLLRALARRVRALTERSEDRVFLDVPRRLAKALLSWSEKHANQPISQTELGELVGATRESVNKYLRLWQREGILTHERGQLRIFQPQRLREAMGL